MIRNIISSINAGSGFTGEVAVVMSGRVCVSVCVSVGAVYFLVNVTNIGVTLKNIHVSLQSEA